MAKETDIALKLLANVHPADWVVLAGLLLLSKGATVTAVDAELSSLGRSADKLLRVDDGPRSYLVHFEFQTTADATMDERVFVYNVMARRRYELPVISVLILMHPEADSPRITGRVAERHADDAGLELTYRVIRLWELPFEPLLSGPVGTLPLAPLAAVPEGQLPAVVDRVRRRLATEPAEARPNDIWDATQWLLVARYPGGLQETDVLTLADLERTTTYQQIIKKGRDEGRTEGRTEGFAAVPVTARDEEVRPAVRRRGGSNRCSHRPGRVGPLDAPTPGGERVGRAVPERLTRAVLNFGRSGRADRSTVGVRALDHGRSTDPGDCRRRPC